MECKYMQLVTTHDQPLGQNGSALAPLVAWPPTPLKTDHILVLCYVYSLLTRGCSPTLMAVIGTRKVNHCRFYWSKK